MKYNSDIDLKVPFQEKDQVKSLGARYRPEDKIWYIPAGQDIEPFRKWLPDTFGAGTGAKEIQPLEVRYGPSPDNSAQMGISDLVRGVQTIVRQRYSEEVWIIGQTTSVQYQDGRLKIELIDVDTPDISNAPRLATIAWGKQAKKLWESFRSSTGTSIKEAITLRLKVKPDFHVRFSLQGNIVDIDPTVTIGELEARLRKIRENLKKEGLWNRNRNLPSPDDYCDVAVIHPSGASGHADFKRDADILERLALTRFEYLPATFEGPNAELSILDALEKAFTLHREQKLDAIAIVRGGGARQGLMGLSTEPLARKICNAPVPVILGIGHADDHILLDDVSRHSCDTPSKVIGLIRDTVRDRAQSHQKAFQELTTNAHLRVRGQDAELDQSQAAIKHYANMQVRNASDQIRNFGRIVSSRIRNERDQLMTASHETQHFLHTVRDLGPRRLQDILTDLVHKVGSLCDKAEQSLTGASLVVDREMEGAKVSSIRLLGEADKDIGTALIRIRDQSRNLIKKAYLDATSWIKLSLALGPEKTIQRGFPLALHENGKPITTATQAKAASHFHLKFRDNNISVTTKGK